MTRKQKLALVAEACQQLIDRYVDKYGLYICCEYGIDKEICKLMKIRVHDHTWTVEDVEVHEVYGLLKGLLEIVLDKKKLANGQSSNRT